MDDFFPSSDSLLKALQNPTISPEQEHVEEQSDIEEETPLLKEILFELSGIRRGIERMNAGGSSQNNQPPAPDYKSQVLEF